MLWGSRSTHSVKSKVSVPIKALCVNDATLCVCPFATSALLSALQESKRIRNQTSSLHALPDVRNIIIAIADCEMSPVSVLSHSNNLEPEPQISRTDAECGVLPGFLYLQVR